MLQSKPGTILRTIGFGALLALAVRCPPDFGQGDKLVSL